MNDNQSLYRIGGLAAIASGVVTQLSGALHPVETATIFDPAIHMKEVAENPTWSAVYVGFSIGFVLMLIGLTAIAKSLRDDRAAGWASIAKSVATATTAVAFVFFILDGFATKTVALSVMASPGNESVLAAAATLDRIGRMFFGQWSFLSWGVTPLLFGITILSSASYKRWIGAIPLVSGVLGMTAGLIHDFNDFSLSLLPPFYGSVLLFNVFMVTMGVVMARRSMGAASSDRLPHWSACAGLSAALQARTASSGKVDAGA